MTTGQAPAASPWASALIALALIVGFAAAILWTWWREVWRPDTPAEQLLAAAQALREPGQRATAPALAEPLAALLAAAAGDASSRERDAGGQAQHALEVARAVRICAAQPVPGARP